MLLKIVKSNIWECLVVKNDNLTENWSRRDFLAFMAASSTAAASISCSPTELKNTAKSIKGLKGLIRKDQVSLIEGLDYNIVIKEGDSIGENLKFGTNNDYLYFHKTSDGRYALWANHESLSPILVHNRQENQAPTKEELIHEREQIGGSFFEVKQNDDGTWSYIKDSDLNFKISGNTEVGLSKPILGKTKALGTLANCSGGYTPWGTILTCEENYHHFYGDRIDGNFNVSKDYDLKWVEVEPQPTEHYGWVVEVDPLTKSAEKLISLGRFSHECAKVVTNSKGYPVVYSGDDCNNEHFYKFISNSKTSLKEGELFVASLKQGKWLSLDINKSEVLKKNFKDQTDVLINCRKAAKLVGATELDRPEDIDQDPLTGDIFVTLTNNKSKKNYHGSILKVVENDKSDLNFKHSIFRAGGSKSGFSCPDNMAFDKNGNFFLTSDISGGSMGKEPYTEFGNNALFLIPRTGPQAGELIKLASAPFDAEFTGPFFSEDEQTLFLSVQHPGEKTKSLDKLTSNWPSTDKKDKPLSSVIAIKGPLLDSLTKKA